MDKSTTESNNIVTKIRQLMEELAVLLEKLRQLEEELADLIQMEEKSITESNIIVANILADLLNDLPIKIQENVVAIEIQPSDDSDEDDENPPTKNSDEESLQRGKKFFCGTYIG